MLDAVVRDMPSSYFGYDFAFGQLAGVRVGCAAYTTVEEVDRLLDAVGRL